MAEVILRSYGHENFFAASAGSQPTGEVNPAAIRQLQSSGHDVAGLRSKSWQEFANDSERTIDIVITVCDAAAGESCPVWSGNPLTAHWGIADPAAARGSEARIEAAFELAYRQLKARVDALLDLDVERIHRHELASALQAIGTSQ